jgi:homoserine dehydrogenase
VDAAKHKGTNIISFWNREKIELKDKGQVKATYFVRLEKNAESIAQRVKEVFGEVEEVKPLEGEYAFITQTETEIHFAQRLERVSDFKVISKIRIEK